jgi:hypothetical protein
MESNDEAFESQPKKRRKRIGKQPVSQPCSTKKPGPGTAILGSTEMDTLPPILQTLVHKFSRLALVYAFLENRSVSEPYSSLQRILDACNGSPTCDAKSIGHGDAYLGQMDVAAMSVLAPSIVQLRIGAISGPAVNDDLFQLPQFQHDHKKSLSSEIVVQLYFVEEKSKGKKRKLKMKTNNRALQRRIEHCRATFAKETHQYYGLNKENVGVGLGSCVFRPKVEYRSLMVYRIGNHGCNRKQWQKPCPVRQNIALVNSSSQKQIFQLHYP